MIRAALTTLAFWAALAGVSAAQRYDSAAPLEELRSFGEQVIADAHAEGVFTVSDLGRRTVGLRHTHSGLRCFFRQGESGSITIFAVPGADTARGDDVGCTQQFGTGLATLYATRTSDSDTLDGAFSGAVTALRSANPSAQELDASELDHGPTPQGRDVPESRSAAFAVQTQNGAAFTRVSVAVMDGWEITLRFTGDSPRDNSYADMLWDGTLIDLEDHADMRAQSAQNDASQPGTPPLDSRQPTPEVTPPAPVADAGNH